MLIRGIRALAARPLVYDAVQTLAGSRRCLRRLHAVLPETAGRRVLDVGAGTGKAWTRSDGAACYVGLDLDLQKLIRLRSRHGAARVVCADAGSLPVRAGAFDLVMIALVSHHLENGALRAVLGEVARVCRGLVVIMDAVEVPSRPLSRLLWRYDLGAYPRERAALLAEIERMFEVEHLEEFSVLHRYVLCRCRPRPLRAAARVPSR